jgi:hypothetical protein
MNVDEQAHDGLHGYAGQRTERVETTAYPLLE